ncbi:hypothetical protein SPFM15_00183 [Salmonella phage SPFM15]|nr:hypothetical protein SPFM5_00178 [Salmonella phage SPFM5]VFR13807.1 hypothetical protein SPFM15_00183 [Salmonella phage SPFM15]
MYPSYLPTDGGDKFPLMRITADDDMALRSQTDWDALRDHYRFAFHIKKRVEAQGKHWDDEVLTAKYHAPKLYVATDVSYETATERFIYQGVDGKGEVFRSRVLDHINFVVPEHDVVIFDRFCQSTIEHASNERIAKAMCLDFQYTMVVNHPTNTTEAGISARSLVIQSTLAKTIQAMLRSAGVNAIILGKNKMLNSVALDGPDFSGIFFFFFTSGRYIVTPLQLIKL